MSENKSIVVENNEGYELEIEGVPVTVIGGTVSKEELTGYVRRGFSVHGRIEKLKVEIDGDFVELSYKIPSVNFERIRRITGYLVGTLDRFNDAKRSEEHDRVKHDAIG